MCACYTETVKCTELCVALLLTSVPNSKTSGLDVCSMPVFSSMSLLYAVSKETVKILDNSAGH